jgi:hypothetical protein
MAGAIPTNSARTQGESVASLAVSSDGGRDGFRRRRHRQAAVLFSAVVHRRRPRDRACCPCRVGRTLLKMRGHPTPANISTLAADRRNGRLQLKSASSPFPSVHRADLEGPQGVDLTRSPNHRGMTASCAFRPKLTIHLPRLQIRCPSRMASSAFRRPRCRVIQSDPIAQPADGGATSCFGNFGSGRRPCV